MYDLMNQNREDILQLSDVVRQLTERDQHNLAKYSRSVVTGVIAGLTALLPRLCRQRSTQSRRMES
jgi:hypothetical protein